ncbi:hypothetical protein LPJ61_002878, partial [Coemansia biformis]
MSRLHPMDPPPWCDPAMRLTLPNVHSFQLPDPSWEWVSPRWLIDMTLDVDDDGWQYASRFSATTAWHGHASASRSFVRRRRWLRLRRRLLPTASAADGLLGATEKCLNEGMDLAAPIRKRRSSAPKDMATKIKCKISRNYVGKCPKVPATQTSAPLTFTLKDGRYRSHRTKAAVRAPTPPPSPADAPPQQSPADAASEGLLAPAVRHVLGSMLSSGHLGARRASDVSVASDRLGAGTQKRKGIDAASGGDQAPEGGQAPDGDQTSDHSQGSICESIIVAETYGQPHISFAADDAGNESDDESDDGKAPADPIVEQLHR